MPRTRICLACTALLLGAWLPPALAGSSATSSASGSVSASSDSASNSLKGSSNSSRTTDVAEGDYRIVEVAALDERPGTLRLTLQAVAQPGPNGTLQLDVSQQALAQGRLAAGQTVSAHQRPYGLQFDSGVTGQAFFLVLADDWHQDLPSRAVTL